MLVTVAICTWNRAKLLDKTLARMAALRVPAGVDWELVVVNNNSTDDTPAVLGRHASQLPLRSLIEPKQGHSHARNCALSAAHGDLLVWTDDDVLVARNWLGEYVAAANAWPEAAYFGGQVIPWYEEDPPTWAERHLDLVGHCWAVLRRDNAVRRLAEREYVYGANMAFRTELLRRYMFDPALGRVGNALVSGDDFGVQDRLRADGHFGVWVGSAAVRHFVTAERLRLDYVDRFHHEGFRATARQKTDWSLEGRRLFGVPRWAIRRYVTSSFLSGVLRPLKNRRWMEAFIDRAKVRGYLIEARLAARRASVTDVSA